LGGIFFISKQRESNWAAASQAFAALLKANAQTRRRRMRASAAFGAAPDNEVVAEATARRYILLGAKKSLTAVWRLGIFICLSFFEL
jgi:hypothetical protein